MMIAIPSFNRPEKLKKFFETYPSFINKTIVYLSDKDKTDYKFLKCKTKRISYSNIAECKQKVIEDVYYFYGLNRIILMDDDCLLAKRTSLIEARKLKDEETSDFLYNLFLWCSDKFPLVSPIMRYNFQNVKYPLIFNKPAIRCVALNLPTLFKHQIKYTDMLPAEYMSDRYVQLSLLKANYYTLHLGKYTVDDSGTNTKGGCSEQRTAEKQSISAFALRNNFPDWVKLKVKNNGNWSTKRYDTIISWKNTFKDPSLYNVNASNYVIKKG